MKTMRGNLIDLAEKGHFDVIVHGCNCYHKMGAGIAKEIKQRYPQAFYADRNSTGYGSRRKLGNFTSADSRKGFLIVNAYTQYDYRSKGVNVDYRVLRRVFELIAATFDGARIGYPAIGAGLAGGDWKRIAAIIDWELKGQDHTFVEYSPET